MATNDLSNYVKHQCDTILVLGNGFDLHCDLHSDFKSFYENQILKNRFYINDNVLCNIWYLLFYLSYYAYKYQNVTIEQYSHLEIIKKGNPLWMDIETLIKSIITGDSKKGRNKGGKTKTITYLYNMLNATGFETYYLDDRYLREHFESYYLNPKNKSYADLYTYLLNQLQLFEKDFARYIVDEVHNNLFYAEKSKTLLESIVDMKSTRLYVVDFNYTGYSLSQQLGNIFNYGINEIHGDAKKGDVIIGFDSSDVDYNDSDFKGGLLLSKSWQKLNQDSENEYLPNKDCVKHIIFYGHSLGNQDYSYFHTFFDKYDLYDGKVVLVFCYSDFEDTETKRMRHRMDYLKNVHALLNDYAIKSGRESKTCNTLVNRLELENRIFIRRVDDKTVKTRNPVFD